MITEQNIFRHPGHYPCAAAAKTTHRQLTVFSCPSRQWVIKSCWLSQWDVQTLCLGYCIQQTYIRSYPGYVFIQYTTSYPGYIYINASRVTLAMCLYSTSQEIGTWFKICCVVLCCVVGVYIPLGLLHWHWGNHMIAPVPVKQPWRIWENQSYGSIEKYIDTTKHSTTRICAYFMGCTIRWKYHTGVCVLGTSWDDDYENGDSQ